MLAAAALRKTVHGATEFGGSLAEAIHVHAEMVTVHPRKLVSVIIPTRDRADVLGRAVRSVLDQTWPDLEVIVVDDGSSDGTGTVVTGFADERIRLVRREGHIGAGAARNEGIRRARGDWIAFLDSDDEWVPTKLARQMARLKADRTGATVVYCQAELDDALTRRRFVVRLLPHEGDTFDYLLAGWSPPTTSIFMVARAALLASGGFDLTFPCGEDYDLWLRLARGGNRFLVVDRPLVIKHEGAWPRITSNPVARRRGFELLDRRWGPVIESRLGRRARRRWRSRARARIDHAHSLQAREAVRAGNRRVAWAHCVAMVLGLPRSARHLVRGLVYTLVGWPAAATLERLQTSLREKGRRWQAAGGTHASLVPPSPSAFLRPPTGFSRRRDGSTLPMTLPSDWMEALVVAAEASRWAGISYAVVGSLGIAVSQGLDFQPVRRPSGGAEGGLLRDLDVFLLGPDEARDRFKTFLAARWSRSRPMIDVVPIYHDQIHFSAGGVTLRYRDISVPLEPRLFEIFEVPIAGLRIPVLHPGTHLHMMGQNPLFRKTRWNIRCLARAPRGDLSLPIFPESSFRGFHRFKRIKVQQHYARYAALRLREELYTRELDGSRDLVVRAKRLLRQRCPQTIQFLRQRLG